jgi:hypothetical protein
LDKEASNQTQKKETWVAPCVNKEDKKAKELRREVGGMFTSSALCLRLAHNPIQYSGRSLINRGEPLGCDTIRYKLKAKKKKKKKKKKIEVPFFFLR